MKIWLTQHKLALAQQLRHVRRNLAHSLLMSLAIGVTLALPLLAYIVTHHLGTIAGQTNTQAQISVFLQQDVSEETRLAIGRQISQHAGVRSSQFVPKTRALEQLEESAANPELIESLPENPLPDAFFVEPNSLEISNLNLLKGDFKKLNGVAEVVLDTDWINQLNAIIKVAKQALALLAAVIAVLLVTVIGNTIRMQILAHQDEIEVSQLIGATRRFIRRPFLYMGALYGLAGGFVAILLAWLTLWLFNNAMRPIARNYLLDISLQLPNLPTLALILLIASVIGWLAAWFAFAPKRA